MDSGTGKPEGGLGADCQESSPLGRERGRAVSWVPLKWELRLTVAHGVSKGIQTEDE